MSKKPQVEHADDRKKDRFEIKLRRFFAGKEIGAKEDAAPAE